MLAEILIDNVSFSNLMMDFYESDEMLLVWDNQNEFSEQVEESYKAATEQDFDPFKAKLEKTLDQYQKALRMDQFKNHKEREIARKMVMQTQEQIRKLDMERLKTAETHKNMRLSATHVGKKTTQKERDERALNEIYSFYSKIHMFDLKDFTDFNYQAVRHSQNEPQNNEQHAVVAQNETQILFNKKY